MFITKDRVQGGVIRQVDEGGVVGGTADHFRERVSKARGPCGTACDTTDCQNQLLGFIRRVAAVCYIKCCCVLHQRQGI